MVRVGVIVRVGRGIAEGGTMDVSVGEDVGATVEVSVDEGSGLVARVGSMMVVGEDPATNVNPPQPSKNRVAPNSAIEKFRK